MNMVHIKLKIIPAHNITRCWDCEYFKEYGAAYQDGDTCTHENYPYDDTISGDTIPDHCPLLKENKDTI